MEQIPVADPPSHALDQFVMRNAVEVSAQVRVDYFRIPAIQPALHLSQRLVRAVIGSVGVLLRLHILVHNRFQHPDCPPPVPECGPPPAAAPSRPLGVPTPAAPLRVDTSCSSVLGPVRPAIVHA